LLMLPIQEPALRLVVGVNLPAPQPRAAHLTGERTSVLRGDRVLVMRAVHVDHERVIGACQAGPHSND